MSSAQRSGAVETIMDDQELHEIEADVIGPRVSGFLMFAGSVAILMRMVTEAMT